MTPQAQIDHIKPLLESILEHLNHPQPPNASPRFKTSPEDSGEQGGAMAADDLKRFRAWCKELDAMLEKLEAKVKPATMLTELAEHNHKLAETLKHQILCASTPEMIKPALQSRLEWHQRAVVALREADES